MGRARDHCGGIVGLGRLVRDRFELIEADFQRYYGLDLRAEIRRIGVRRLRALVHGLPADAVTWRQEREERDRWTTSHELAALAIEVSDMWGRIVAQLLRPKYPNRLPKPVRINRPDDEPPERPTVEHDPRAISAFFAKHFKT